MAAGRGSRANSRGRRLKVASVRRRPWLTLSVRFRAKGNDHLGTGQLRAGSPSGGEEVPHAMWLLEQGRVGRRCESRGTGPRTDSVRHASAVNWSASGSKTCRAGGGRHGDGSRVAKLHRSLYAGYGIDADVVRDCRGPGPHVRGCWRNEFQLVRTRSFVGLFACVKLVLD